MALSESTRALIRNYCDPREASRTRTFSYSTAGEPVEISATEAAQRQFSGLPVFEDGGKWYYRSEVRVVGPYITDRLAIYTEADLVKLLRENDVTETIDFLRHGGGTYTRTAKDRAERGEPGPKPITEQLVAFDPDDTLRKTHQGYVYTFTYTPAE